MRQRYSKRWANSGRPESTLTGRVGLLSHRGILAVKGFTDNEFGPALIFEHHPRAVRLDHYLAESAARLDSNVRLSLLRQTAEAMKYAHGKGV